MKKLTDRNLWKGWLGSTALYALVIVTFLLDIGIGYPLNIWLSLTVSAVPAFCLQLLLCRRGRLWTKGLPLILLAAVTLWMWIMAMNASGWDGLGWLILMLLSIAPAVGFVLGWVVYGVEIDRKKRCGHG